MRIQVNGRQEDNEMDIESTSIDSNEEAQPFINKRIEDVEPKLFSLIGLRILISCFILQALSFGPISSFGIFNEYLHKHPTLHNNVNINISLFSWVGTLCASLNSFFSLPSGLLCDYFGHKKIAIVSCFIISLSLLLASFSTQLWHLYLSHGMLCGIGIALANMPATSLPVLHFKVYGGLATGITSAGAGIGGMCLSYLNGYLLNKFGYAITLRINALVLFIGLLIGALMIVSPKLNHPKSEFNFKSINIKYLFNIVNNNLLTYSLFGLVGLFHSFAYLVPFYFLGTFTSELNMPWRTAALLISILNISSGIGKISLGLIGDKISNIKINVNDIDKKYNILNRFHLKLHPLPYNTYSFIFLITLVASAISTIYWMLACIHPFNLSNFHQMDTIILCLMFTFVITYGVLSGGSITCSSMVAKELFGMKNLTSLLGFYKASRGLGFLFGSPIGSHLINIVPNSGYRPLVLFVLFMLILSSVIATFIWKYVSNHPAKAGLNTNTSTSGGLTPNMDPELLLPENIN